MSFDGFNIFMGIFVAGVGAYALLERDRFVTILTKPNKLLKTISSKRTAYTYVIVTGAILIIAGLYEIVKALPTP